MKRRLSIIARASLITGLALSFLSAGAQQTGSPHLMQQPIGQRVGPMPLDSSSSSLQQIRMAHSANVARQKQLVKDSAKLVELTANLKEHMAKQGNQKATDEDLRLITQIEKLAHNIREEMAYAGEAPPPAPPPQPLIW